MARIILILILVQLSFSGHGQKHSQDVWHSGKVILRTGDTLKGSIKYNLDENILQFRFGKKMVTLTPKKTNGFIIQDSILNDERVFKVFGYNPFSTYKPLVYFEVLVEGSLTLLSRETVYVESMPQFDYFTNTTYYSTRRIVDYSFFFKKKVRQKSGGYKDEILPYNEKKKQLYEYMAPKEERMREYVRENKILIDSRSGLILLVQHYNRTITNY